MKELTIFAAGFLIALIICIIFFRSKKPTHVGEIVIENSDIPYCYMALSVPFGEFQEKNEVTLRIKHINSQK